MYIYSNSSYQILSDKCEIRMMPFEEEPAWYSNSDEYRQEILQTNTSGQLLGGITDSTNLKYFYT